MSTRAAMPMFPTEAEIARELYGPGHLPEWRALAVVIERHGFPQIDQRFGRRFWPACEQWFMAQYGLAKLAPVIKQDGGETCPAPKPKRPASDGASGATVHRLRTGAREPTS